MRISNIKEMQPNGVNLWKSNKTPE